MDLAVALLAALFALLVLCFARVGMMLFIVFSTITTLTGFAIMATTGTAEWTTFWSFGLCFVSMWFGYAATPDAQSRASTFFRPKLQTQLSTAPSDLTVTAVVLLPALLAFYHLLVGGIPLFSNSIEVDRFDFTSSGLFGIPGRMYLYGVPLAWAFATAVAHFRGLRWTHYKPWVWATASYLVISILSGFKSGLSAAVMLALIFGIVITNKKVPLRLLVFRYWWALSIPMAYALLVAANYATYQSNSQPPWRQLVDRMTLVGAEPKQLAIEQLVSGAQPGAVWDDFIYFITKYSGGDITGMYSFERAVSAQIIGVNPASAAWTTPVTVGGIPELIFSFGLPVSALILFVVGCAIRVLHRAPITAYSAAIKCALIFMLYSWLTKGGLAYYVINITAVTTMLYLIYLAFTILIPSTKPEIFPQPERGHKRSVAEYSRIRALPRQSNRNTSWISERSRPSRQMK